MRKSMLLAAFSLVVLSSAAQADEWCRRDFGARQTFCHYASLSQCMIGVRVSGGICERSHDRAERPVRHASATYGPSNISRLRASYTRELGHITYTGKPACD